MALLSHKLFAVAVAICAIHGSLEVKGARFVILGGVSDVDLALEAEVIDLDDADDSCSNLRPMPLPTRSGPEAQLLADDSILMCGGKDVTEAEAVFLADCLRYDFSLGVWTPFAPMEEARWDAESLFIGDELAMFGGRSGSDSFSSTAESLDPASLSWGLYDDLAMPGGSSFFQHCMVKVNDSLAFMAGGYKDGVETYSDEAYLLDLETFEWAQQASTATSKSSVSCGMITGPGGQKEIVAQNGTSVEIFNLSTLEWRLGPDYPEDVLLTSPGQLEDTFVLFGGKFANGVYTDSIYRFDQEDYRWERLDARLSVPRFNVKAVEVPDRLLDC